MKVLVIGCGSIGSRHARNLRQLGAEVGIYDTAFAARSFAPSVVGPTFTALEDAMGWAEAIVVASPAQCHVEHLAHGIGRKLPTFVEKPLALTADKTLRDVVALATLIRVPVQVGYNLRFQRAAIALRGTRPQRGLLMLHCDRRTWPGTAYGPMLAECSHEIDLALWLGAPPVVTAATLTAHRAEIALGGGFLEGGWDIVLDDAASQYSRSWNVDDRGVTFTAPELLGEAMYLDEMRHFLDVAAGIATPRCTLQDGLAVLEIMDQARRIAG